MDDEAFIGKVLSHLGVQNKVASEHGLFSANGVQVNSKNLKDGDILFCRPLDSASGTTTPILATSEPPVPMAAKAVLRPAPIEVTVSPSASVSPSSKKVGFSETVEVPPSKRVEPPPPPTKSFKLKCKEMVESIPFDIFIVVLILIDAIFFVLGWFDDVIEDMGGDAIFIAESALVVVVFVGECAVKIYVYGWKKYIKSWWNRLDFVVTILTVIAFIVELAITGSRAASAIVFLRLFRLLRFIRLINKVRTVVTKKRGINLQLPAGKCLQILQTLKKQWAYHAEHMEGDDIITKEDIEYVIKHIRQKTLYRIVLGEGNVGDEEMQAYLKSTVMAGDDDDEPEKPQAKAAVAANPAAGAHDHVNTDAEDAMPWPELLADHIPEGAVVDTKALESVLATTTSWDFDVFKCGEVSFGNEVVVLGYHCFTHFDLLQKMCISHQRFRRFLFRLQSGYRPNPYHNGTHAADVLQATFFMLAGCGLDVNFSDMEIFAMLLSALIHDFEHPGVNNAFLINTDHELAIRYNDKAVLEMHHVAAAFKLMKDPEEDLNLLAGFTHDEYKHVRAMMVDMVLGTEMAAHFEVVQMFQSKLGDEGIKLQVAEDKKLAMKMLLHVADVSNPARNFELAGRWTKQVMEEFYSQGDQERANNLNVSPFMNRQSNAVNIPKCQVGFIDFIVEPLHKVWAQFLAQEDIGNAATAEIASTLMTNVAGNRTYWNTRKLDEEAILAAAGSTSGSAAVV